jgi:hypothetical protein
MKRASVILLVMLLLLVAYSPDIFAQGCSQCRMVPESDMNGGSGMGRGINNGILYLLSVVYIFFMVLFFVFRKQLIPFFKKLMFRGS